MDVTDRPRTKLYKGTGISPAGSETTQMALAHQDLVTAFCECHQLVRARIAFYLSNTYA